MTSLTRWNPLQEIQTVQTQLNRLFDPFFSSSFVGTPEASSSNWLPAVDIEETGEKLILRAELPGFKPDQVDIQFENGVLTLRGQRQFENERNDRTYHRIERSYGSFVRSFTLPMSVDADRASARFTDGILELEMPKKEEAKPKRITIS